MTADRFSRLELVVRRKLEGRFHGSYEGFLPGHGTELGEARRYEPGDDVRRIDWAVSARLDRTHVRETIADHELQTVAVLDRSASLDFGTARTTKREVALQLTAALGFLTAGGANRFGVLALEATGPLWIPPATGRAHVHAALRRLDALPVGPGRAAPDPGRTAPSSARGGSPPDLEAGLATALRLARRPGFVAVVSDLVGPPRWSRSLRALARRHEVLVVEVVDPRELALPNVGWVVLEDPETGRRRGVDTADADLRRRFAAAAAARRDAVAREVRRAGADHLVLRTDRDPVADLVRHVERRRRTRRERRGAA